MSPTPQQQPLWEILREFWLAKALREITNGGNNYQANAIQCVRLAAECRP